MTTKMNKFFDEFKQFALRGNVIDLAVGIIVGGAFGKITKSLVDDIIMPPLGYVLGKVDFSNLYIDLSRGNYSSLTAAQEAGAPIIRYGMFINTLIDFLILALVIFIIITWINNLKRKEDGIKEKKPVDKTCPYCYSKISIKAKKCPYCTSALKDN